MSILVSSFPQGGYELNLGSHRQHAMLVRTAKKIRTKFLAVRATSTTNLGISSEAGLLERSAFRVTAECPEKCRCIQ
jgi:hypothetical protein